MFHVVENLAWFCFLYLCWFLCRASSWPKPFSLSLMGFCLFSSLDNPVLGRRLNFLLVGWHHHTEIYSSCAMTGSRRHMCSAPRTGNRLRQKWRIISGIDLNGRLNCPRMYSPESFCCWIRMCMKPLALLWNENGGKILIDCFWRCLGGPQLTSTTRSNPAWLTRCFAPRNFPRSTDAKHSRRRCE